MPIAVSPSLPLRIRRTVLAGGAALVLAATVTAGCGAGFEAQTNQPYQSAEGGNGDAGALAARNVLVIADDAGKGTLHGVLVNTGDTDDRLASVRVETEGVQLRGSGPAPLPAGQTLTLGTAPGSAIVNDKPAPNESIVVTGAKPGRVLKVTFSFGTAGPITVSVPVLTTDHYSPTPKPTPTTAEG